MIKVILFDLGGVLIPEMATPIDTEMAKIFGMPYQSYLKKISELKPLVRKGSITLLDMYSEIIKSFNIEIKPECMLQKHIGLYKRMSTERNNNIIMLIEKLKPYYKIYCITETEKEIAKLNKKNGLFSYFSKAYLSIDLGYTKLEPMIYLKVLKDLKHNSNEILLIDDKVECVAVAKSVGIKGIVFRNIEQLENELDTNKIIK